MVNAMGVCNTTLKRKKKVSLSMGKETTHIIIVFVITLIVSAIGDVYLFTQQQKDIGVLHEDIQRVEDRAENDMSVLNNLISAMQEAYESQVKKLMDVVAETQEESEMQFSELKDELKGISVESGDFSAVVEDAIQGVVSVLTDRTQGSGAIVTSDGFIVTNNHVIKNAKAIAVRTYDKNLYNAFVYAVEPVNDLAILKVNVTGLYDLGFANSDKVKVGEKVVALGNPAGLGFTVTEGIISQKDRNIARGGVGLLQVDVAINPGNSGGPVLNKQGDIVGIARLKIEGLESLGFAIPSNFVAKMLKESNVDI